MSDQREMTDFETNPVGTLAELEKLKAERDAALEQAIYWRERAVGAEAEREDLQTRYHLLASEMVYEGNSVQHWRQKALAYKECAGAIYDLKQIMGVNSPAETAGAVKSLAAHVVRLRKAALDAIHYLPGGEIKAELRDAYDDTPDTSLARQKLLWQAEAISRYAAERLGGTDQELAEIYASKLRRQAEEAP